LTDLYQLKGSEWVALRSPVDATLPILERAQSERKRESKDKDEQSWDYWTVEKWIDADTALMSAQLRNSYFRVVFTLKFDPDGNWKIVHQTKEKAE
jgi:CRISPR/Cas system-associated protein Cas10 (large subunit of type III CRISPR-Cas system)